jgi:DNA-binding NarL/FixJ family response regulator
MRGHRVQSTAAAAASTVGRMVTTTQKRTLDPNARLEEWIGHDESRASPTDIALLRRQLECAMAGCAGANPLPGARAGCLPPDGLRVAATDADDRCARPGDASAFWAELTTGRARRYCEWFGPTRSYAVALRTDGASRFGDPLGETEVRVALHVLCGHQQKAIAADLGISHSTASKRYSEALERFELVGRPVPLPLVVAAQAAARVVPTPTARRAVFEHHGCAFVVLSVPRPRVAGAPRLTASERSVALQLVEGRSRHEIAAMRETSVQTVSCQLRAVFAKLRLTGRYAVIRRAGELGWFQTPPSAARGPMLQKLGKSD